MTPVLLLALWACGGDPAPSSVPSSPSPPSPSAEPVGAEVDLPLRAVAGRATTPTPSANPDRLRRIRATLAPVVTGSGLDANNPWALGHAMLALGTDVSVGETTALDAVFAGFAERDAHGRLGFPASRGSIRVEPHPGLVIKALSDAPVPLHRAVEAQGKPATVEDLVRGELSRAGVRNGKPLGLSSWNDAPWRLHGLASYVPKGSTWRAEDGSEQSMDGLTEAAAAQLRRDTQFLRDAMAAGGTVQKRRQGIFSYTCGGAHMLTGVAYAVAQGHGSPGLRDWMADEIAAYYWRVDVELQTVDAALQQYPEHGLILMVQRLKFLGHFLETAHRLAAWGLYTPTPDQRATLERVEVELERTVQALAASGALENLEAIRAQKEQTYLDLIGDSAHAIKGIDLALGDASVPAPAAR